MKFLKWKFPKAWHLVLLELVANCLQSLEVDFSQDTVFIVEEEERDDWPSPSFVVNKWAFCDEKKPTSARSRKQSIPSDVQLIQHCHCFLKKKGVPFPVVITGLQFSRESKMWDWQLGYRDVILVLWERFSLVLKGRGLLLTLCLSVFSQLSGKVVFL